MNGNAMLNQEKGTIFKDSVIKEATQRAEKILQDARKKRDSDIEEAYNSCEHADKDKILAGLKNESSKEYSALILESRQELLKFRKEMVEGLFADVEKRLEDFAAGSEYLPWLLKRLAPHEDMLEKADGVKIHLRNEDKSYQKDICKAAPGCEIVYSREIRLGGLYVSDGKVLFDESLDRRLREEKEKFYHSGEFMI